MPTETPNATAMEAVVTTVGQPACNAMIRDSRSRTDADQSADDGDQHGLRQELTNNVGLACTDGAANTDFARALEHRGQHDVHDADAADQQRDAGDTDHDDGEDLNCVRLLLLQQPAGTTTVKSPASL